jgi:hypothetical protein
MYISLKEKDLVALGKDTIITVSSGTEETYLFPEHFDYVVIFFVEGIHINKQTTYP